MRRVAGLSLIGLTVALCGCNVIGAILYYLAPRQWQAAEFELAEGRVALLIECARPDEENPIFSRELHGKVADLLAEQKVAATIVPYRDAVELRRSNVDYPSWSIQRIGRELDAQQVIYVRVDSLRFREAPDHPVLSPGVALRVKVIGTHEIEPNIRLWPDDPEGFVITHSRTPVEAVGREVADAEAAKLGRDTGQFVARLFYKWDAEQVAPPER